MLSLLPPLLVLTLGFLTRRVIISLAAGIILAAFIATNFSPSDTLVLIGDCLWINFEFDKFFSTTKFWETWNLFICIFLFILGIFVCLLQHSGGAYAYGTFIRKTIHNRQSAETSSLLMSTSLFIDDYFSSLTVGSVMYPLTDTQQVPRAKLSFLVDSMSAPLAILCPFSSWVAAILGFLRENGISSEIKETTLILGSPLTTYFNLIPFLFYSFVLIASTWFIVRFRIAFGLMKKHEDIAKASGNLFGGETDIKLNGNGQEHNPHHTTLSDFFLPVIMLLICVIGGMLYSGDWQVFGGARTAFQALQYSSAAIALFLGGIIALIGCTLFFIIRKRIPLRSLPKIYLEGLQLMLPAVVVLMLAWSLGDILRNQLNTGEYLAKFMLDSVSIHLLPALLFFASTLVSFTIGSSWGTAAMMFPIAIPMVLSFMDTSATPTLVQTPILFPVLGAVLSGCVAGDHISPISDTTIMSATSTRTPHMDHVRTQIPYALPMIIMTGIGFLLSSYLMSNGFWISSLVPIIVAILSTIFILWQLNDKN